MDGSSATSTPTPPPGVWPTLLMTLAALPPTLYFLQPANPAWWITALFVGVIAILSLFYLYVRDTFAALKELGWLRLGRKTGEALVPAIMPIMALWIFGYGLPVAFGRCWWDGCSNLGIEGYYNLSPADIGSELPGVNRPDNSEPHLLVWRGEPGAYCTAFLCVDAPFRVLFGASNRQRSAPDENSDIHTDEDNLVYTIDEYALMAKAHIQDYLINVDGNPPQVAGSISSGLETLQVSLFGSSEVNQTLRDCRRNPIPRRCLDAEDGLLPVRLPPGLHAPGCGGWLWNPTRCATNRALRPLNRAYYSRRDGWYRDFETLRASSIEAGTETQTQVVEWLQAEADRTIDDIAASAKSQINRYFWLLGWLQWIGITVLALASLRILLVLFARRLHSTESGGIPLRFARSPGPTCPPIRIAPSNTNGQVTLSAKECQHTVWLVTPWHISPDRSGSILPRRFGEVPGAKLRRPFGFWTHQYELKAESEERVVLSANITCRFHEIEIPAGGSCMLDMNCIVARTSNTRLTSKWYCGPGAFAVGQFVHVVAHAPPDDSAWIVVMVRDAVTETYPLRENVYGRPTGLPHIVVLDNGGAVTIANRKGWFQSYMSRTYLVPCDGTVALLMHKPTRATILQTLLLPFRRLFPV